MLVHPNMGPLGNVIYLSLPSVKLRLRSLKFLLPLLFPFLILYVQAPARAEYIRKGNNSLTSNELANKLDEALEAHLKELDFITSGDAPLSNDEIVQLAKTSYYTLSQFRYALIDFAKSIS